MNTAQRILFNTVSLLAGNLITNLLVFISVVYLARVLGPNNFGKLNFAIAFVAYFILIANLGLPLLGAREIAAAKNKIKKYLGYIWTLRLTLALFGFLLLGIIVFFLNTPRDSKYLIMLYGLEIIPSALVLDWVFQGTERMEYISFSRIISCSAYLLLVLCFVAGSEQLLLIPCFKVISSILLAGVFICYFVKEFGRPMFKYDPGVCKVIIRKTLPIGFSLFMTQIFYSIDTIMLGFMRSNKDVGYYNSAYMIIMVLILCVGAYHNAIYPLISKYFKTSLTSLEQLLESTIKLMSILAVPLAIGGTILARVLIGTIFGSEYKEGVIAFQILIWAVLIIFLNTGYSRGILACNKENWFFWGTTIPAVVNVISNFIMIPFMGIRGAAIATVLAEASGFCIMYNGFKRVLYIPFWRYTVRPIYSSLIMSIFLYWGSYILGLNLFILVIGGILIYSIFLYIAKGISEKEIRQFYQWIIKGESEPQ